ncbi:plastocyanin [Rhodoferax sp.]|uniref:plastocyanin n=1 Tax=Rhodoferax sp. TaxID=50421 RepID=UPI0025E06F80|nr:plastocyanin [Rhodoferax sp.]
MHLTRWSLVSQAAASAAFLLCHGVASAGTLEVLVLDRDGKPAPDSVVIVLPTGKGQPRTPLPLTALVNQEKQQFSPAVTVVGVGAKVRFSNSDPWNHHVRLSTPGIQVGGSEGQSALLEGKQEGKPASAAVFSMDKPGAVGAALLGCFIHSRMSGAIYVADSPWTVKTNSEGVAVLEDVPEGVASIKVWHAAQLVEKAALQVNVPATPAKATFQLDVAPRRRS